MEKGGREKDKERRRGEREMEKGGRETGDIGRGKRWRKGVVRRGA